ncbi:MAG: hypothetical protein ACRELY_20220, partial [Polyangiaceae bacterium]
MRASPSAVAVALALTFATTRAHAVPLGDESDPTVIDVHAFLGQGFLLTKDNNYINSNSSQGSVAVSEVGINFTKPITDRLRFGVQLFAQDFGTSNTYVPTVDWAYGDYRFADWLGLRVGRVKIPFGLYNEVNDIDSARTFVLLPQGMYPLSYRQYLFAQTGAELYGYLRMGDAGALDYHVYGGTLAFNPTNAPGSPYTITNETVPFVFGGRLMWETPVDGLRLGGSVQTLRADTQISVASKIINTELPATFTVASIEYAAHDLQLAAEYGRWFAKLDADSPLFPSIPLLKTDRFYALASYRFNRWFQPGIYYSVFFPNTDVWSGAANHQHDFAIATRFDVNSHWLFKLEGHYMVGTGGL